MSNGPTSFTTREVVVVALNSAATAVAETAPAAIEDEPDGVHQHRIQVRRLRSVLAGFRVALDAPAAKVVRLRYREWGRDLGVVRDIEVRADVAEEELAAAGVDDPHMRRRLVESERESYVRAHARLVEIAANPRAEERRRLLDALVEASVVHDPDADAAPFVAAVLAKQARRVRKAVRRIDGSEDSYHAVRKAARRLRYVSEAVAHAAPGLYLSQVAELTVVGDALHDSLGGHRDALMFADHVAREAVRAARAGESVAAYPAIEASARAAAAEHLTALPEALDRLRAAASDLR
ncbi:CHAD domain-containing protein [Microbacterium sp. 4R-513]|uniref:CHAD domain-containing protein n=1 Tax=Microbacterium sp. 4R-513 TaxID=2567934 RepID=UPI0013E1AE48|nr:CHAD domain-containing protein [Microbacterium sp. 4R-513]QIG38480.1 CHAD domain-containing protein [Microbacterium sp. 4R-513]